MTETLDPVPALEAILTEHGPLHEDAIEARLREAGAADTETALNWLRTGIYYPAAQLVDDRWVWLPTVLTGRVFTHRVSADETSHDMLTATPDLSPIVALCNYAHYQRLTDGSTAQLVLVDYDDELLEARGIPDELIDEGGVLLLAPGTLETAGLSEGDVAGVRLTADGLTVERVAAVADAPVGPALAATLGDDDPELFDAAVWTACAADPKLFTEPVPPLSEVADDYGLARRDAFLALGGFDFGRWDSERACALLAAHYNLGEEDAFAVYSLAKLHAHLAVLSIATGTADTPLDDATRSLRDSEVWPELERAFDLVAGLGTALTDPALALVLAAETDGTEREGAIALGVLAELLESRVSRPARVAFRWLRAVALERIGDIDTAERDLLAAESMDVEWPLPLLDLARIASDRGDAESGLALLHRAGAEAEHPLVQLLLHYRTEPRAGLGRNEPCWCGSGRKYKKCHLGHEQLPLAERVGWLYSKATQQALLGGWEDLLAEAGYERGRYRDDDTDDDPDDLSGDPLVIDAVLFEGGAFAEFLRVRGSLLPDDERALAGQWLLAQRSVFEIEQVQRGQGVTVRDMRTGDRHDVQATRHRLQPGQLVCARLVPAGDTSVLFGVEPVDPADRDSLIELLDAGPDPVELVAQLSR